MDNQQTYANILNQRFLAERKSELLDYEINKTERIIESEEQALAELDMRDKFWLWQVRVVGLPKYSL